MKLVIVHNHFRPGGVRRVIELAAPHLARALRCQAVTLAGGEGPDAGWQQQFQKRLGPVPVDSRFDSALLYCSEQHGGRAALNRRLQAFFTNLLAGAGVADTVVWAHNQGLGRNLPLARALTTACAAHGVPLVFHQHDWWFDNRWQRWPEMRRTGYRRLEQVAETLFPHAPIVRHAAINHADAAVLQKHFPARAGWIPNLTENGDAAQPARVRQARKWLDQQVGQRAPVWLMPCRLLRRKNIAEALLLMRWLRPEAWLVTTGGVSSTDEVAYARHLAEAVRRHRWPLRLGILAGDESTKPAVPELMAASEALLLTSLQEGFGLPYLEAAKAGKPLLARALPNIAPDLARFGFSFPQYYDEILVAPALFDLAAERRRQATRFATWRKHLPRVCQKLARPPALAETAVPFSRLTLDAQIEVLAHAAEDSWARCAPLNPFLRIWRDRAGQNELRVTRWPRTANRWLDGAAYARNFQALLASAPEPAAAHAADAAQWEFITQKLAPANLYPALWSTRP